MDTQHHSSVLLVLYRDVGSRTLGGQEHCARVLAIVDNQKISLYSIILGVQGVKPPEALAILSYLWVKSLFLANS